MNVRSRSSCPLALALGLAVAVSACADGHGSGGPDAAGAIDAAAWADLPPGPPDATPPPPDGRPGCDASCGGRVCGDDGCGGTCGAGCPVGTVCQADGLGCVCDPALPAGWPAQVAPWPADPVLVATRTASLQGQDNVYAPELHDVVGMRVMWYGAQGADGHDRIFLATSANGQEWRKYPRDDDPQPVLDRGASNHVNDPSVVRTGGTWRLYYTDAPTGTNDRIWLAESSSLTGFQKVAEVLGPGPAGSWESSIVGRPSVLLGDDGTYRMWYDGSNGVARHVGLATSTDGVHFTRHPQNPIFLHAGAVDVKRVGGVYVMVREAGDGTYWATSVDGICWVDRGRLFGLSGAAYDRFGQVTPFLDVAADGSLRAVWFGGAQVATWNENRIAVAFPAGATVPPGGGCTGCLAAGVSCAHACQTGGHGAAGSCASPGSTDPGACCACGAEGCEGCVVGADDCHEACVNAGHAGGVCGWPGSTNPSQCCVCP